MSEAVERFDDWHLFRCGGTCDMADRYKSYTDLAAENRRGVDYDVRSENRGSAVIIIAPHGGTTEPETSALAEAIAGNDLSFYAFEAFKKGAHSDFHITSHRFDEPVGLDIVGKSTTAVAIHGRKDDGTDTVWLGGRNEVLRDAIGAALRDAGFGAELNTTLPGVHEANICNRTISGEGVQLELSRSLRKDLAMDAKLLATFSEAVRRAIGVAD